MKTGDEYINEINGRLKSFYTYEERAEWWKAPQPQFSGLTALQMVEARRAEEVLASIKRLEDAVYL